MTIVPGPWQDEIARIAERCAQGDLRTAMAMLLAAHGSLVSRCVTSEHASDDGLRAAAAFQQAAADQLSAAARFYRRGADADDDDERAAYMGTLHDQQNAAAAFAEHLRDRYDALEPTPPNELA